MCLRVLRDTGPMTRVNARATEAATAISARDNRSPTRNVREAKCDSKGFSSLIKSLLAAIAKVGISCGAMPSGLNPNTSTQAPVALVSNVFMETDNLLSW